MRLSAIFKLDWPRSRRAAVASSYEPTQQIEFEHDLRRATVHFYRRDGSTYRSSFVVSKPGAVRFARPEVPIRLVVHGLCADPTCSQVHRCVVPIEA